MLKHPQSILGWAAVIQIVFLASNSAPASEKSEVLERFEIPSDADLVTVPVTIANKTYHFFIDTGATVSVCDAALRPLLERPVARTRVSTANGRMKSGIYRSPGMLVGRAPMKKDARLLLADLTLMRQACDLDLRGIVGMDFLAERVVCFDFDSCELRFLASAHDAPGQRIPLVFRDATPFVIATVPRVGNVEFMIDSGSGGSSGTISKRVFGDMLRRGALVERGASRLATVNGRVESRSGNVLGLSIGSFNHSELQFDESEDQTVLGLDYLKRYTVTFDFPHSTMYLEPGRGFSKRDLQDASGLHILRIDHRATVHSVDADSPAERARIRSGDIILKVDSMYASRTRLSTLRRKLCEEGTTVSLTLERAGSTRVATIKLADCKVARTESAGGGRQ